MIIWLNGPFGVGKTTLTKELKKRFKWAIVYDPEYLGFILQGGSHDFQDIRLWRNLTGWICHVLGKFLKVPIIVPMTVTNPNYLDDIFSRINRNDVYTRHFYLDLGEGELKNRIENDERTTHTKKIRDWRISQLSRCLNAKKLMPEGTIFLSAEKSPPDLASEIQEKVN